MKNMFSDRAEKQVPRDLRSCYKTDAITRNLWVWCERLEKWGGVVFWLLLIYGIFDTIQTAMNVAEQHDFLAGLNREAVLTIQAQVGDLPSVPETVIICILKWLLYAFLEYCGYHVLALLIGSLASIVQHNKIAADVALYTCATTEGYVASESEEFTPEATASSSPAAQSEPQAVRKHKKAPALKADEWYCPDCDRIHKSYVGTCGCGMMRPAAAAPKAPVPTPTEPQSEEAPVQIPVPALKADEWYCPDCNLVHKTYVGTCGCGRKRP